MSSIVSIDTRGYDISMGPGVIRVGGGGGLRGNVYINGNVGVGAADPGFPLDVSGTMRVGSGIGGLINLGRDGAGAGFRSAYINSTSTNLNILNQQPGAFQFGTNNGEKMRIDVCGNVGIGTTSPAARLDVNGSITASGTITANGGVTTPANIVTTGTGTISGKIVGINVPSGYNCRNGSGSNDWCKIGVFTATQTGQLCIVKVYGSAGYNANPSQSFILNIFFKTSNGSSVDSNGFAGDCYYTLEGDMTSLSLANPHPIWIANAGGVSATNYTLYIFFRAYGNGNFYTAEVSQTGLASWLDAYTFNSTPPSTTGSTTCLVSSLSYTVENQLGYTYTTAFSSAGFNSTTTTIFTKSNMPIGLYMFSFNAKNFDTTTATRNDLSVSVNTGITLVNSMATENNGTTGAKLAITGTQIIRVTSTTNTYTVILTNVVNPSGQIASGTSALVRIA